MCANSPGPADRCRPRRCCRWPGARAGSWPSPGHRPMRSGTTMLASFLNSQDDICIVPDAVRVPAAALIAYKLKGGPSNLLNRVTQERLWRAVLHVSLTSPAISAAERQILEAYQDRDEIPAFTTRSRAAPAAGRRHRGTFSWVRLLRDQGHARRGLGREPRRVLGAKAIILLRDPRAVFVSQQARLEFDRDFVAADLEDFVTQWRHSCEVWRDCDRSVLALKFEDFVSGDEEFGRLSEYLGLAIKADVRIFSENSSFGDVSTGSRRQGVLDRWREVGDVRAVKFIEREAQGRYGKCRIRLDRSPDVPICAAPH